MDRDKLLISVITVCYNASLTIEKTIQSIVNQDYNAIEYIIIDGASSDKTIDIIKKYSTVAENDKSNYPTFNWISEPDSGIYDAMNKGIRMATGDYLIFMGADDIFANNHVLSEVSTWLKRWHGDVVYGSVQMKTSGRIDNKPFNPAKFAVGNICHQCIFYPRELYIKLQYDTNYPIYADYVYNLKARTLFEFHHIPTTIAIFNDQGISGRCVDHNFNRHKRELLISSIGWKNYIIGSIYKAIMISKEKFNNLIH